MAVSAMYIHKTKHDGHGQDANKAQGEAECFIGIEAALSALFYIWQELGHALTVLKNLHVNA